MKLGVSYNAFDGEELLESSIKQIRDHVDYISVVYQKISNYGNKCSDKLLPTLTKLHNDKLVDELFEYKPNLKTIPHWNEVTKRHIGLSLSVKNGCTHHLSMDCDEFYVTEEFINAKQIIIDNGFKTTACRFYNYYKEPIYMYARNYVTFIFDVNNDFVLGGTFPVVVDPTRIVKPIKFKLFDESTLVMHNMNFVRRDLDSIRLKLLNSSARINFKNIDKTIEYYDKWKYPMPMLQPGGNYVNLKKVNNKFGDILKNEQ